MQGVWKIHTQKLGKLGAVVSSRRCCISQALTMKLFQQCEGCFPFSSAATSIYSLKAAESRKPFAVEKLEESTVATNWALSNHDMPSPEKHLNYDGICSVLHVISIDLSCVCQSWTEGRSQAQVQIPPDICSAKRLHSSPRDQTVCHGDGHTPTIPKPRTSMWRWPQLQLLRLRVLGPRQIWTSSIDTWALSQDMVQWRLHRHSQLIWCQPGYCVSKAYFF